MGTSSSVPEYADRVRLRVQIPARPGARRRCLVNVAWSAPRPRQRPPDERALEHAALASPARLRILDLLVAAPGPLHTDDLEVAVGLHSSTLRGHLLVLVDGGFVEQVVQRDGRPGRPRVRYGPTAKARVGTAGCLGYRTLAHVLSAYLDHEADDPSATGEDAGRTWARYLTRAEPTQRRAEQAMLERAGELLESIGFRTGIERDDEGQVLLSQSTCPFAGVVDEHAPIVCSLHRGVIQGILEGVGVRMDVEEVAADRPQGPCVVRLARRPAPW